MKLLLIQYIIRGRSGRMGGTVLAIGKCSVATRHRQAYARTSQHWQTKRSSLSQPVQAQREKPKFAGAPYQTTYVSEGFVDAGIIPNLDTADNSAQVGGPVLKLAIFSSARGQTCQRSRGSLCHLFRDQRRAPCQTRCRQ